jgi:hypothetical protein
LLVGFGRILKAAGSVAGCLQADPEGGGGTSLVDFGRILKAAGNVAG